MKIFLRLLLLTMSFATVSGRADGGLQGAPARTNVSGGGYPRILPDQRVVFRVSAPEAHDIQFQLDKPYAAVRDANGVWTATSDPQVPGFHYCWMLVDHVQVNDPASETFFGWGRETSGIEIPEKGADYAEPKDVPHGEVRERWYHAGTTGEWRRVLVYTPPGYDTDRDIRYPVLYLQHGRGENESGWSKQGRLAFIMDNLIADGKARPMLVVMEHGYAHASGEAAGWNFLEDLSVFSRVMMNDLLPTIDATYRTIPDREHRALAGLSMGGAQALQIGLDYLDAFAYLGGFSAGGLGDSVDDLRRMHHGVMADAATFNRRVRLFWTGAGTAEPPELAASVRLSHETLDRAGINNVYYESPGTAHEWLTWRRCLHEFAPLLFTAPQGTKP
jgi:enterochelin esterase-like enzyme